MGRSTAISGFFSLLRTGSAATILGAAILSCSDTATAPSAAVAARNPALDGVRVYSVQVPDSIKRPWLNAAGKRMRAARSFSAPVKAAADESAAPSTYTIQTLAFNPEPSPAHVLIGNQPENPEIDCGDCVAFNVPIGFAFTFYGNSYSELSVSSNGLVGFGSALGDPTLPRDGCCSGWGIPSNDANAMYNNIIALAWTDWTVSESSPVTVETQGTAPNRKFVLQWNNVPEYIPGTGRMTAQLVLSEGSNDITMYTTSMNVTNEWHMVTQGIQNAEGSEAAFLPGRMQEQFVLSNDAIRFKIRRNPITIVAPPNLELGTRLGTCAATAALGQPVVSGVGEIAVLGIRNDRLALNAEYPKGVTIVTWTATDADGTTEFATQTVTVVDNESPQITAPANVVVGNDPGLATAQVNVGVGQVADNCPNYSLGDAPNGVYPVGVTPVIWTATDEAGNIGRATQLVTVKDVEAPTISLPPTLVVNATSRHGAIVSFASFGHDNVGVTSFSCNRVSGTKFPIGQTSVSCSAVDAAGNKSAPASLKVTVIGASQQIVNLVDYIKVFLPVEKPESHGNWNDSHRNDKHRKHMSSSRRKDQLVEALSLALSYSRSNWGACMAMSELRAQVRIKTPSVFPAANSAQILADIARIKEVLDCR